MAIRMVVTFLLHAGRMSCLRAAGAVSAARRDTGLRSAVSWHGHVGEVDINSILRQSLLEQEAAEGLFVFLIDATLTSQAGQKTANTYSTGNRKRRPRKRRRYGKIQARSRRTVTASRWAC